MKGNIFIDSGVSQLDGVYIAQPRDDNNDGQPDSGTGRIYTCTNGPSQISGANLYTSCQGKLTINGAFIANQVKFLRSNGTLRNSSNSEPSDSGNIAEVFVYSPELYLINPGLTPSNLNRYDSITSLPPVL